MITALALITSSCVENSGKYKAAVAERDSLAQVNMALDSSYNQTLDILNDIEQGFAEINQQERNAILFFKIFAIISSL